MRSWEHFLDHRQISINSLQFLQCGFFHWSARCSSHHPADGFVTWPPSAFRGLLKLQREGKWAEIGMQIFALAVGSTLRSHPIIINISSHAPDCVHIWHHPNSGSPRCRSECSQKADEPTQPVCVSLFYSWEWICQTLFRFKSSQRETNSVVNKWWFIKALT